MRMIVGLVMMPFGALLAVMGYFRLGIGRHGAVWWKPFTNHLSSAHVGNLVSLGLGLVGMVLGAWLVVSALRRA